MNRSDALTSISLNSFSYPPSIPTSVASGVSSLLFSDPGTVPPRKALLPVAIMSPQSFASESYNGNDFFFHFTKLGSACPYKYNQPNRGNFTEKHTSRRGSHTASVAVTLWFASSHPNPDVSHKDLTCLYSVLI